VTSTVGRGPPFKERRRLGGKTDRSIRELQSRVEENGRKEREEEKRIEVVGWWCRGGAVAGVRTLGGGGLGREVRQSGEVGRSIEPGLAGKEGRGRGARPGGREPGRRRKRRSGRRREEEGERITGRGGEWEGGGRRVKGVEKY
jgi:hypothetical protein